ncbi:MAG: hypothetical protein QNK36_11625 [Colwellia sp.]|nr:hypothetical protein [Colwellia sp.]
MSLKRADLQYFDFPSESSNLKLGISAIPMIVRTTPTDMKKNIDAIRLADMGLSLPTLSSRRYSITPEANASTKLTTAETSDTFCNTPFSFSYVD